MSQHEMPVMRPERVPADIKSYNESVVAFMRRVEDDEEVRTNVGEEKKSNAYLALLVTATHMTHMWSLGEDVVDGVGDEAEGYVDMLRGKSIKGFLTFLCDLRYPPQSHGAYMLRDEILKVLEEKGVSPDAKAIDCERELADLYNVALPNNRKDADWLLSGKAAISLDVRRAGSTRTSSRPFQKRA